MFICMTGYYAFTGNTSEEAYKNMIESDADCDLVCPSKMRWFTASEVKVKLVTEQMPKPKSAPASKK